MRNAAALCASIAILAFSIEGCSRSYVTEPSRELAFLLVQKYSDYIKASDEASVYFRGHSTAPNVVGVTIYNVPSEDFKVGILNDIELIFQSVYASQAEELEVRFVDAEVFWRNGSVHAIGMEKEKELHLIKAELR